MKNVTRGGIAIIAAALIVLFNITGCGDAAPLQVAKSACESWKAKNNWPMDGNDWPTRCYCSFWSPDSMRDPRCNPQPDFSVSPPDLKPGGFGCEAALAGADVYGRGCWSEKANFTNGKADPAKVLACQVTKDLLLFGNITTPAGKGLYSLVLACMAAQCPKGGVITYTDAKGVTINIGFDSTYICINELVRGNNNACNNQLSTCNDDGDNLIPMAQAPGPVPGGGGSSSSVMQEVCIDIPAWPSTQPLPGDNGIVLIGDVQVDLVHGGRACMTMPVTTGVIPN